MIDTSEKNFEASIESLLLSLPRESSQYAAGEAPSPLGDFVPGGFRKGSPEDYELEGAFY